MSTAKASKSSGKSARLTAAQKLDPRTLRIIIAVVAVAVIAAGVFIVISLNNANTGADVDYGKYLQWRTDDGALARGTVEEARAALATLQEETGNTTNILQWRTADGAFMIGNPNAPITIVEFANFLCPNCQNYKSTMNRIMENLIVPGNAMLEYRILPTAPVDLSIFVNQVAECAADLYEGGFWPIYEEIYVRATRGDVNDGIGRDIAGEFDIEYADVLTCTQEATQYQTDQRLASRVSASGTPAIRIRYNNSEPQLINPSYERGGVPYDIIESVVMLAQS
jgi:protein-disulfide isomerase